jgi:alpha-L-arabinofuranosidase B-like protein
MFCAAVAGLLLIGVALTQFGGKPAAPAHRGLPLPAAPAFPPPAGLPVPAAGSASSDPAPARSASRPPTTSTPTAAARQQRPPVAAVDTTTTTRRPAPRPTGTQPTRSRPATAPVAALRAGSAVSLELADAPGYRVRHRDFRGRTDRIGPGSSALERADSRFVVRPGLADGSCVSFESSNYPGSFLRHRDFRIRLDRADRTRLFARDATFCPETSSRAGVVALRSHNYPDRFLTEDGSLLGLTPATTGTATRFVVRPPL